MKDYDPASPLIAIHVPKTAGQSCKKIFRTWFGDNLFSHYYDEANGKMPEKHDIYAMHYKESPVLLYGHFNRLRGFGIEDYYPEVDQFVTVLRDPFDLMVSTYFYILQVSATWKDKSRVPKSDIHEYLLTHKINMLNHFPREVTLDNYQEMIETKFIEIGITEYLDESMRRIAKKLGMQYITNSVEHLNVTARGGKVPHELRNEVAELNPLEFAVYEYVLKKYK